MANQEREAAASSALIDPRGVAFPVPAEGLSLERIRGAIGASCALANERSGEKKDEEGCLQQLRRGTESDLPTLLSLLGSDNSSNNNNNNNNHNNHDVQDSDSLARDFDLYHTVVVEREDRVVGFALMYWAYSTWEGRYLYANKIVAPNNVAEAALLHTLADIALRLGGQRLVWQHYEDKSAFYNKDLGAETLKGWLTLRMSLEGMDSLLSSSNSVLASSSRLPSEKRRTMSIAGIDAAISEALTASDRNSENVALRLAAESDLHHIERLVEGLAIFDKEEGVIRVNSDHYRVDGFRSDSPLFKCILIENKQDATICGMALFYFGYDVATGPFLYLEDLFVDEPYRGRGYGTLFMTTLSGVAKNVGCTGFVWQALDWSTTALNFYDKIGGKVLDGRLTTRFNGDALRHFADTRPANV